MSKLCQIAVLSIVLTGALCSYGQAQTTTTDEGRISIPATPVVTPLVPSAEKMWRFFLEDAFNLGFSCDLNPRSRNLIVYPHIATLVFIGPEFGLNVRTAGAHYMAFGVGINQWIAEPIVRLSYGQQWHSAFMEVGVAAFPEVTSGKDDFLSGSWTGPRVIPRLTLGLRF